MMLILLKSNALFQYDQRCTIPAMHADESLALLCVKRVDIQVQESLKRHLLNSKYTLNC